MALQARHKGRIQAMQVRVLRWIEGVSRVDRVRNVDIVAGSHQAPGPRIIVRLSKLYYIQLKTVAHPFHRQV